MIKPKFELKCRGDGGSTKVFSLKNVSSVITSNICVVSFVLFYHDGEKLNLMTKDIPFPTSLGPNEEREFICNHQALQHRGVGYKELQFVFKAEDEQSNQYYCVASRNVEDKRNYVLGNWDVAVKLINKEDNEVKSSNKPTVFISYNWGSDDTADELETELSPIATVLRDKSSIHPWGSIGEFMKKIRQTDLVVVIVSDGYMKSIACLYEVMQLLKDENWMSHSMFLVEESAKGIYKPIGQIQYIKHWEKECKDLERELEGISLELVTTQVEELKKIKLIQLNINEFMQSVADRNNPDLQRAIDAVVKRVQENCKESETESEDHSQSIDKIQHPIFDVKILEINKQVPGTAEAVDIWGKHPEAKRPQHKNVRLQIELCNDVIIRNFKAYGHNIDSVCKPHVPYEITVCYMESPDAYRTNLVFELSRELYPARADGIPQIAVIEYSIEKKNYRQIFKLNMDQVYVPDDPQEVVKKDIERIIQMKKRMRNDFLKESTELKKYTSEELLQKPEKKFVKRKVIIMSIECRDPKWNTDGGYGEYEIYDFCDEGLLLWGNGERAEVDYYQTKELMTVTTDCLLCLPFERIVAYDMEGNSGYNEPIIHAEYRIGENPFTEYYIDKMGRGIIDKGLIVEVRPIR